MKTIQEHLREADRKRLLDCLAYRFLSDPLHLLEAREYAVEEIMERYSGHMNSFIERLLRLDIDRSDSHVFFLYPDYRNGETLDLVELAEIDVDIEAPGLDFTFTDWHESLGYLVADTKLTQDNMIQLLAQYLEQASFSGPRKPPNPGGWRRLRRSCRPGSTPCGMENQSPPRWCSKSCAKRTVYRFLKRIPNWMSYGIKLYPLFMNTGCTAGHGNGSVSLPH